MIYTGLGRLGEIADVKAHGGADVAEVYGGINEANPIYYKTRTLTGTLPLSYKALGKPISDYLLSGNTVQDGTPTPEVPVDVQGCGMRTENLFDAADVILGYHINNSGEIEPKSNRMCTAHNIDLTGISEVTLNFQTSITQGVSVIFALYSAGELVSRMASVHAGDIIDVSSGDSCLIAFYSSASIEVNTQNTTNIMLNFGSTALPYEPYGFKLPLTVNDTEYPIYLGHVPTTRRIKKLVLTGDEGWSLSTINTHGIANFWFRISDRVRGSDGIGYCSHYEKQTASGADATTEGFLSGATDALYIRVQSTTADTVEKFKDYISGKGVTIWYVLATPETGIVNEPLMKIGDYADTVPMAQAGVTIPTVAGQNTLTIDTTVQPSAVSITGNIKEVSR